MHRGRVGCARSLETLSHFQGFRGTVERVRGWRELQLAAVRFSLGLLNDLLPNAEARATTPLQSRSTITLKQA